MSNLSEMLISGKIALIYASSELLDQWRNPFLKLH